MLLNRPKAGNDLGSWQDPRDEDGNGISDGAERLPQVKYDTVREAFRSEDGFWKGAGQVIRNTAAGRNTIGATVGIGLDVAGLFVPGIDEIRQKSKRALNLKQSNDMKDVLKRAFTTDGGSFVRVRDEEGNLSMVAIGATVVRLVLVLGVFFVADYFGLPVDQILSLIGFTQ